MELFKPSIDWGHALAESLSWIVMAWAISAVCLLAVLVVLRLVTPWGRQFWRITGGYFAVRNGARVWLMLGILLLSVVVGVRLTVLLSYQANDLSSSIQTAVQGMATHDEVVKASGVHGFWMSIFHFSIMAAIFIARVVLDIYLTQRFIVAWRIWLTDRFTGDWLEGRAYYRSRFIDGTIDNPDQRIQQDIDVLTAGVGGVPNVAVQRHQRCAGVRRGAIGAVGGFVHCHSVEPVGHADPVRCEHAPSDVLDSDRLRVGGDDRRVLDRAPVDPAELPQRADKCRLPVCTGPGSRRRRGGWLLPRRERRTRPTDSRFRLIIDNYLHYVNRTVGWFGFNISMSQFIVPLPWMLQAPRLFAGQIKFGTSRSPRSHSVRFPDGLSFFRNAYDQFASYRAAIIRLDGLVVADEKARDLPELLVRPSADGAVDIEGVEVRTPDGDQLIDSLDVHLSAGDALVITGPSGSGKTTLLRSLAQLWPYGSGTLRSPDGPNQTMFLSQSPYIPLGDLRAVVSYPAASGEIPDAALQDMLVKVMLPHLVDLLDEEQDWVKVLSPGEQQRVAFARVLLTRPKAVFVDEATSAMDEGLELTMYRLLRAELPGTVLISVSHRSTVESHHQQRLELLGEGRWQLGPVDQQAAGVSTP